jgi:hypothetical protein
MTMFDPANSDDWSRLAEEIMKPPPSSVNMLAVVTGFIASQVWLAVGCTKEEALDVAREVIRRHMADTITDELHFDMVKEALEELQRRVGGDNEG